MANTLSALWLLLVAFSIALPAAAKVPARAIIGEVPLERAGRGTQFATLLEGQSVDVLKVIGARTRVRTRGPIQIEGWVPSRQLGLCALKQAPARLDPKTDPIGYVPAGWCFRTLDETDTAVRFADSQFGLTVTVERRFLGAGMNPRQRFKPLLAGFTPYRIEPQPMRRAPGQTPYFTVPQAEWSMRSTHEEGDQAFIEILGHTLVLQGWEQTTRLYKDLFRSKDAVELARQRLSDKARPADPRPWFRLKAAAKLFLAPGKESVGSVDAGVLCTVNRQTGAWHQVRLEVHDKAGKPVRRLKATLWMHGEPERVRAREF